MNEQAEWEAAQRIQAAGRRRAARRLMLWLWRMRKQMREAAEALLDEVVCEEAEKIAAECLGDEVEEVASGLLDIVVAEEAEKVAAECLAEEEEVISDLVNTVADEEAARSRRVPRAVAGGGGAV